MFSAIVLGLLTVVYQQQKAAPTTKSLNAVAIHHFVTQGQLQAQWNDVNHPVIPRNDQSSEVQTLHRVPSALEFVSLIGSIPSTTSRPIGAGTPTRNPFNFSIRREGAIEVGSPKKSKDFRQQPTTHRI